MQSGGSPSKGGRVRGGVDISLGGESSSARGQQRDINSLVHSFVQQRSHQKTAEQQQRQQLHPGSATLRQKVMRLGEPSVVEGQWRKDNSSAGEARGGQQKKDISDLMNTLSLRRTGLQKSDLQGPKKPLPEAQQAHSSKKWTGHPPSIPDPRPAFGGNQGQRYSHVENGVENKQTRTGPSFGFTRLSKFMDSPPGTVVLRIHEDIQAWKAFLDSPALKDDILVLAIGVVGNKVCMDEAPLQQRTNILKACCLSDKFIQKLSNVTSDITMENFPSWRINNSVDCTPLTLMQNIWHFCHSAFETMPSLTKDLLKSLVIGSITASMSAAPELTEKFTALKTKLQELNQVKKVQVESTKARNGKKRGEFSEEDHARFDLERPPENIQDIPVIPTIQELRGNSDPALRPNKPTGAYNDSEHYCDVQFRLFREDFVRPLRNGIQLFLDNKAEYLRKKRMPPGDLRLYCPVSFIKAVKEQENLVHKLQLSEHNYKRVKWATSKRLIYGSLVILTTKANPFGEENTHFGIISNRNIPELEKGIATVAWEGPSPAYSSHQEYLMFESEVYLESRKHTLETLKKLDLGDFQMKKFIVDACSEVEAPQYLRQNNTPDDEQEEEEDQLLALLGHRAPAARPDGNLIVRLSSGKKVKVTTPLEEVNWPDAEDFGLDDNQFQAFRAALTREFAIIQGPPGTGKTFLGLKIADVLLLNQHLWRDGRNALQPANPITVVCYTNHALDQFLEGILELKTSLGFSVDILRIGGNSRSEVMKEHSLQKVRYQKRARRPAEYVHMEIAAKEKVRLLEDTRSKRMEVVVGLQNLQGVVNFELIRDWISDVQLKCPRILLQNFRTLYWFGINPANLFYKDLDANLWVNKWFKVKKLADLKMQEGHQQQHALEKDDPEDELYDLDELMENRIMDDIQMEADTADKQQKDSEFLTEAYLLSAATCDHDLWIVSNELASANNSQQQRKIIKQLESKELAIVNRKKVLLKIFQLYKENRLMLPDVTELMSKIEAENSTDCPSNEDMAKLTMAQKWALYFAYVERWRGEIMKSVVVVERDLSLARKELRDVIDWGDTYIARACHVIGLTTTGAAKYNNLLRGIRSKIVIVEEAAQVFEAQVVTCITKSCQQLIMIGDHKQLQPNPSVYELAIRYNLNLSLFERMLNNNLHCYPLKVQHRMRPEISDLIMGTIYEELVNHESVELYPDVTGVTKNVFFVTHTELEYCDNDSKSKSNFHEANFILGLCRYLILQGYEPDQITVLTTYKGQMFHLRGEMRKLSSCEGVRISSVDDYQGQENDIILVSLVRSNEEGNVGFVKTDNRICVTLSRAKQGLFVIGNMDAMVSRSETWTQIKAKLDSKGFIGQEMELVCKIHENITKVKSGSDFYNLTPDGGCGEMCNLVLPCTHVCTRICHALDSEPEDHKCEESCLRKCANGLHPCEGLCFELPCPPCHEPVERTLNCELKHKTWMPCHRNVDEQVCYEPVPKLLVCKEHVETLACFKSVHEYNCTVSVIKNLTCGHPKEMKCHQDPADSQIKCKKLITKPLPVCGHDQEEECWRWIKPLDIACTFMVPKKLEYCEHTRMVRCCDKDEPAECEEKCATHLECGHICKKLCHGDKDPDHFLVKCKEPCSRKCPLREHKCPGNHSCFMDKACPPCTKMIEPELPCGHKMRMKCQEFTNKTYKCLKPCTKTLPGDNCQQLKHKCPKKCFEECGPCQIKIEKTSLCGYPGHQQVVACGEPARKESCMVPVNPKRLPSCGHRELFPCKLENASPEELAKNCNKPCDHIFTAVAGTGCTHKCGGTCSSCLNGRLHMKCQEKCERSLVCGHRCEVKCSKACPPCKKKCRVKCQHGKLQVKCKKTCGEPCIKCKQLCDWTCEHETCTQLCHEMCNRKPCDVPCPKKVKKCGHPCIGFCGEPCPPLCRICDKEALEEQLVWFAVEAEIEDARFVYLEDCPGEHGHTIEVTALERHLLSSNARDDGRIEIGMKCCPKCTTPIINCRRFGNLIRQSIQDVLKVKKQALGNMKRSNKLRDDWIQILKTGDGLSMSILFPEVYARLKGFLLQEGPTGAGAGASVPYRPKLIDETTMKSLDFTARSIGKAADGILDLMKKDKFTMEQCAQVTTVHRKVFGCMLDRQPLSRQEMLDFNQELDRCDLFKQLMIRRSMPNCNPQFAEAYTLYKSAKLIVTSVLPLSQEKTETFLRLLKELDCVIQSGLAITERERQEIVAAVGIGKGHWFKCRNGHPYVIADCGGATIQGVCHICKSPIGGADHRLVQGNRFAPEMDGASGPAWPTMI